MERNEPDNADELAPSSDLRARSAALSRSLVPNNDATGSRQPRSMLRENLLFFAVFIPLVLLATGVIFLVIHLVR